MPCLPVCSRSPSPLPRIVASCGAADPAPWGLEELPRSVTKGYRPNRLPTKVSRPIAAKAKVPGSGTAFKPIRKMRPLPAN